MNTDKNRDMEYEDDVHYKMRRHQRELRMREMRQQKKQQEFIRKIAVPLCVVALLVVGGVSFLTKNNDNNDNNHHEEKIEIEASDNVNDINDETAGDEETKLNEIYVMEDSEIKSDETEIKYDVTTVIDGKIVGCFNSIIESNRQRLEPIIAELNKYKPLDAKVTDTTTGFNGEVVSTNGILIDLESNIILAQKDATMRISPASMTKILTLLVAAENVENLDDKFTMTIDITDYSYVNDCSNTGFEVGEQITVRDLMYGTILPSGADAALGLAVYVAGSHEAFVDMMNDKLDELGLSDTAHFTNCVGLYDANHYCTLYDMAVMMKAVADNEICREIMCAKTYTTSITPEHPEGIIISNWFLRRIEDKDTHGEVLYAKTGFVAESGSCAVSYARGSNGKDYICVTANSSSSWRCIYDHVEIYQSFL